MPSTNKLSSHRLRSNSWHHVSGSLAKFLLSFCGIASFGVFTILVALTATFSVSILSNNSVSALSTVSNQVSVTIPGSIALRLLDSTATAEIDSLSFDLTPTASGVSATRRTIVDVATSNPTGYKLYMQSNYQKSGSYTTDLVHTDSSVSDSIPTSTSASTLYWNYNNPLTSTTNPIPAHGTPDKIGQRLDAPTNSDQIPIDINVSVDTSIVSGTYENQLLFSAVGNPTTVNYTITFNMAGGEPQIPKVEERSAAGAYTTTLPSTVPIKPGFQFRNWLSSADGKTYNPGDTIQIYSDEEFTGDVTLTAQYDPTYTYTLTYNCNGGTGCPTNTSFGPTIDTSHSFTIPSATITKTGYTFTGFKGSDGNNYSLGDTITVPSTAPNFTLTAQYSVNQYTLTIKPNGGKWNNKTTDSAIKQNYNTKYPASGALPDATDGPTYSIDYDMGSTGIAKPTSPTSASRSFTGWTKGGTGTWDATNKVWTYGAGDGTLTANWNTTSDSFNLPTLSKTGYTCAWHQGSASGAVKQSNVTITGNTVFYAVCTINQHNVTVNKGTGISSVSGGGTKDYNSTVTLSATPSTGYHHIGWTVNSGGVTINNNQFTMPDNDVTVTANAALNTCSIKYNANAPSGTTATGSMSNSSMTYGSNTTLTSNAFAVTGYSFQGWAESATGAKVFDNGGTISGTTYCTSHNTTKNLYAVWAKKYSYTLNLKMNDGTSSNFTILNYANTTDASHTFSLSSQTPTRSGYNFKGWATSSTGTSYISSYTLNSSAAGSTPTSEGFPVTGSVYAIWEKKTFTITFTKSNVTSPTIATDTIEYGQTKTYTVTPSSGYYLSTGNCSTNTNSTYTCSGLSTGTSKTGSQTLTVKNNNYEGELTVTLSSIKLTLPQMCSNADVESTFTHDNISYIKLHTNNEPVCYTASSVGTSSWPGDSGVYSGCPSGTKVPTKGDFQHLIDYYGSGGGLNSKTGWFGSYWTSTPYGGHAYLLGIGSTEAYFFSYATSGSSSILCLLQ